MSNNPSFIKTEKIILTTHARHKITYQMIKLESSLICLKISTIRMVLTRNVNKLMTESPIANIIESCMNCGAYKFQRWAKIKERIKKRHPPYKIFLESLIIMNLKIIVFLLRS
jgi:hypothetical protein